MPRLVYILAASHSGSTLLAMLLNGHRDVCSVGELKATNLGDVERYRCSCGTSIAECAFWRDVTAGMARRGLSFDIAHPGTHFSRPGSAYARRLLRPLHRAPFLERVRDAGLALSPTWRHFLADVQRRNTALIETLCEQTGVKIVADSSKIALRLKYLLRNLDLDVQVIRLIRDGRGVALTYTDPARFADATDPRLRGGGTGGDRRDEILSVRQAAHEWRRSNEEAEHLLAGVEPHRRIEVRYEDFCRDPDGALDRLFGFLGVDPAGRQLDFRSASPHVIGNGMRLDTTSEIRLDERWRTALGPGERAAFDEVAGDLNRRYGYT